MSWTSNGSTDMLTELNVVGPKPLTTTRCPTPLKKVARFVHRAVVYSLIVAAFWNVMAFASPPLTRQAGYALTTVGLPPIAGMQKFGMTPFTGGMPPPGLETSAHPPAAPTPKDSGSTSYVFLNAGADQRPVSFDPCRPIHYVVRPQNSPKDGSRIIAEAVAAASAASGFVFINDGATSETPSGNRQAYQPLRYGDRWAPVLFAWETSEENPNFSKATPGARITLGNGGSLVRKADGWNDLYVTGQVRLNADALSDVPKGAAGRNQVRAVIEHELGHVLGLDHVDDPSQLMAAQVSGRITHYAPGDLEGLAILGTGKCRPGA